MQGYLIQSGGGLPLAAREGPVLPMVMQAYLSTVYFPSRSERSLGLRTTREMRTLGLAVDLIVGGHVLHGLDVLLQRFMALEMAAEQGSWDLARWLELIPSEDVAAWSREDLRTAMREQDLELRLSAGYNPKGKGKGTRGLGAGEESEYPENPYRGKGSKKGGKGTKDKKGKKGYPEQERDGGGHPPPPAGHA